MTEWQVRRATLGDADAIAEVHVSAWQAAYRGQVPDPVLDGLCVERHGREWRRHLGEASPSQGRVFVVTAEVIVGFAMLTPSQDADLVELCARELVAIYVHPSHWGCGAGRALLEACLQDAACDDTELVSLWVLVGNRRARRFYEQAGFEPDGRYQRRRIASVDLAMMRYSKRT